MLVLTRKENEQIQIGDDIKITVVRLGSGQVRLGIEASKSTPILRSELKYPESRFRTCPPAVKPKTDAVSFGSVVPVQYNMCVSY